MRRRCVTLLFALAIVACRTELVFDDRVDAGSGGASGLDAQADSDGLAQAVPPCANDSECGLTTLHCDVPSSTCVECTNSAQCTDATRPRCDSTTHRCVPCETASDCAANETCDAATKRCIRLCSGTPPCPPETSHCETSRGICAECTSDADCDRPWKKRICDMTILACVECTEDTQCAGATPHCDRTDGACVECRSSAECPVAAPLCAPATRTCVAR